MTDERDGSAQHELSLLLGGGVVRRQDVGRLGDQRDLHRAGVQGQEAGFEFGAERGGVHVPAGDLRDHLDGSVLHLEPGVLRSHVQLGGDGRKHGVELGLVHPAVERQVPPVAIQVEAGDDVLEEVALAGEGLGFRDRGLHVDDPAHVLGSDGPRLVAGREGHRTAGVLHQLSAG